MPTGLCLHDSALPVPRSFRFPCRLSDKALRLELLVVTRPTACSSSSTSSARYRVSFAGSPGLLRVSQQGSVASSVRAARWDRPSGCSQGASNFAGGPLTNRRVTIVTSQLAGYDPAGGVGTASGFLAAALARMGHDVAVLYAGVPARPLGEEWGSLYSGAGVSVRGLPGPKQEVEPRRFQRIRAVELALRADPPDVVIAHEHGGLAYSCLRLRRLGLAFEETLFLVVSCHGTRRWVKEMNRNERVSREVLAQSVLEQASAELADVVVSPSAYMIEWMRQQGWQLPEATFVTPCSRALRRRAKTSKGQVCPIAATRSRG